LHCVGIAVDQDHAAALLAEQYGGGGSYAAGASGYDADFALEASAHADLRMRSAGSIAPGSRKTISLA
jgi:hypothetical protein